MLVIDAVLMGMVVDQPRYGRGVVGGAVVVVVGVIMGAIVGVIVGVIVGMAVAMPSTVSVVSMAMAVIRCRHAFGSGGRSSSSASYAVSICGDRPLSARALAKVSRTIRDSSA